MSRIKNNILFILGFIIIASSTMGYAWGPVYHHGGGGYYGPGFYPGWGGPNVIINVPIVPVTPPPMSYYAPACETVEVCDQFDECWLERRCS